MLRIPYVLLAAVAMTEWSSAEKIRRAAMCMALGFGVVTVYGVVQALGMDPMPWKGSHGARVFSTMGNPNMLAGYVVAVLPFMFLGVRESAGVRKVMYALGLAGAYLMVWLAGSRSGFIGAGAASVVMLWPRDIRRAARWLAMCAAVTAAVLAVQRLNVERHKSVGERRFILLTAVDLIREKPLLGHGLGSFRVLYPSARRVETWSLQEQCFVQCRNVYNEFLEVAVDEGVIGLGIFLVLIAAALRSGLGGAPKDRIGAQALLASLAGVLAANTVSLTLRYASTGAYFWVTLGLAAGQGGALPASAVGRNRTSAKPRLRYILTAAAAAAAVAGVAAAVRYFIADWAVMSGVRYSREAYRLADTEGDIVRDILVTGGVYESDPALWEKAVAEYRRALAAVPDSVNALYFLANAFNRRWDMRVLCEPRWGDRPGEARTDFERAEELYTTLERHSPDFIEVHYERAMLYLKKGDLLRAKERLERYIRQKPYFAKAQYYLGKIYMSLQRWDDAEEWLQEALHLNDRFVLAHADIAVVYHKLGKRDLRDEAVFRAREWAPPLADKLLGNAFAKAGEFERALEHYRKAREARPQDPEVPYEMGWCFIHVQQWENAARAYRDALRIDDRFIKAWINLSSVLGETGDRRGAMEALQRAMHIDRAYVQWLLGAAGAR